MLDCQLQLCQFGAVSPNLHNASNVQTFQTRVGLQLEASIFASPPADADMQYALHGSLLLTSLLLFSVFPSTGRSYTFTRMCQGYCESQTIYNQSLRYNLHSLRLSPGTAPVQYVDDWLMASPMRIQCDTDTPSLLVHLADQGHKASLFKLLGHDLH